MPADEPASDKQSFISLLRAPLFHDTVLMGIAVWRNSNGTIIQQRITQFPSMWLYRAMHPKCCVGYERISMLMHSVTSYAALHQWPDASMLRVAAPFPFMAKLLRQGAQEHNFTLTDAGSDIILPLHDPNYMELWRRKWASLQQRICAVCWSADAAWQCDGRKCPQDGRLHYYCGDECASHDWLRHYTVDGCGNK